jgi:3-isopropylmalate dehydrogenase
MLLSAAMMLDWLGERHGNAKCLDAARLLEASVDRVFAEKTVLTPEFGGKAGTAAVTKAVIAAIG